MSADNISTCAAAVEAKVSPFVVEPAYFSLDHITASVKAACFERFYFLQSDRRASIIRCMCPTCPTYGKYYVYAMAAPGLWYYKAIDAKYSLADVCKSPWNDQFQCTTQHIDTGRTPLRDQYDCVMHHLQWISVLMVPTTPISMTKVDKQHVTEALMNVVWQDAYATTISSNYRPNPNPGTNGLINVHPFTKLVLQAQCAQPRPTRIYPKTVEQFAEQHKLDPAAVIDFLDNLFSRDCGGASRTISQ